ncbi:MAG: histone deacetylase family protein [Proteobacteria bacterium]|nr:histone deacetylase family protein [Pseudomonadota bacterium]
MTTLLYVHDACLEHDPGPSHPESPDRLRAIRARLEEPDFAELEVRIAPRAELDQIARVHPRDFVDEVLAAMPERGYVRIDADTIVSPGSREASLRAAGAVCAAVDAVMTGEAQNAFCAVRPPGHHAEPTAPMGFCVFNNVAIGALQAHAAHGCERVAVIDFDVHHGNGTQAMFAPHANRFFASTHQYPLYPGTGARSERGVGNIVNAPLPPGAGGPEFRHAMSELILPRLSEFAPDFILISAGFDAHEDDPLASLRLHEADYAWITTEILRIARYSCQGRVVSTLEGGYDLTALAESAAAHVRALMAG